MRIKTYFTGIVAALLVISSCNPLCADTILTTQTDDTADLDFDGMGNQTNGDLGITTISFQLTGQEIPTEAAFANITSIDLNFDAAVNTTISALNSSAFNNGIGLLSAGDGNSSLNQRSFNSNRGEMMDLGVLSTASTSDQVLFSGLLLVDFDNNDEITLSGATVSGSSVITASGSQLIQFDQPTANFSFEATNGGFRLGGVRLTTTAIPEPSTCVFMAGLSLVVFQSRRKRIRLA